MIAHPLAYPSFLLVASVSFCILDILFQDIRWNYEYDIGKNSKAIDS